VINPYIALSEIELAFLVWSISVISEVKWIFFARSVQEKFTCSPRGLPGLRAWVALSFHPVNNDFEQPPAGVEEPAAAGAWSLAAVWWVCDCVGVVARLVSGRLLSPDSPVTLLIVNGHFFYPAVPETRVVSLA
jgi:hypothetical protein